MTANVTFSPALRARVEEEVARALPQAVAFRHERHRHPELTWKEERTAAAVLEALRRIDGIDVRSGVGRNGLLAVLKGSRPGPTVALRADMDGLPIMENSGKPWTSQTPGTMHACGHDGHMANLLGSLTVLSRLRNELRGTVVGIFQPAEEGGAGGDAMVKDGALQNPRVDVIFGLHGWPELPVGHVGVRTGAIFANTGNFRIAVRGRGGHAAMPHLSTDQVLIAARIVEGLQAVAARTVPPAEPVAVTVSKIHGGTACNVIPSEVVLEGTLRATNEDVRDLCEVAIGRLARGIAEAHGAAAEVSIERGYPATINEGAATDYLEAVAAVALDGRVRRMPYASLGGEDFAYFLQKVRGSYFLLGVGDGREGGYPSLHHPAFDFNDEALATGMKVFTLAALGYAEAGLQ